MNERSGLTDIERRGDALVRIARCPEHGLHGDRTTCFVCGEPVEQVEMVPASQLAGAVDALRMAEVELDGRDDFDPDRRVLVLRAVRGAIAAAGGQ